MTKHARRFLISCVVFAAVFCGNAAYGYICKVQPDCGFDMGDVVFVGTAIRQTHVEGKRNGEREHEVFRFLVSESFKGSQRAGEQVEVSTEEGFESWYGFVVGSRYLVDAHRFGDKELHTGICGATAPEKRVAALVRDLRLQASGQRMPDLSGRIAVDTQYVHPSIGSFQPLPGIGIKVRSLRTKAVRRVVSDYDGIYTFEKLEAGDYEVSPELPSTLTTDWHGFVVPGPPLAVTVPPSGSSGAACHEGISVHPTGRVAGTVTDGAGHALIGSVYAYRAPSNRPFNPGDWEASTDVGLDGKFKLGHLRSGGYTLRFIQAVNDRSSSPQKPRQAYYFGGPTSREALIVGVIEGAPPTAVHIEVKF